MSLSNQEAEPGGETVLSDAYRLAAIDLDGTLLGSNHALSVGNAAAVRRAASTGAKIVLASGRQWRTINAFAGQLDLPPDAPIIAYNGAMIRTHGGETWFHQPLPASASQAIVHFTIAHGYHLNLYHDDTLYVQGDTVWGRLYRERTGTIPQVTDLTRFDGERPTKLLLIDTLETTNRLLVHFQAEFGGSLYITKTEDEFLEFMDPDINKGAALKETADRLGVKAAQCAAFGDSYNDLPMVEWAGMGVAMGNARAELKAVARRIAPTADEDGVGAVLDQLFPVHP